MLLQMTRPKLFGRVTCTCRVFRFGLIWTSRWQNRFHAITRHRWLLAEARNSIMIFAETRAHSNPVVTSYTLPVLRARTRFMHKERVISKHRIFYTHRTYACFYLYSSYRNCVFQTHKRVFWPSQMFCRNRDENESIIENEVLRSTKA